MSLLSWIVSHWGILLFALISVSILLFFCRFGCVNEQNGGTDMLVACFLTGWSVSTVVIVAITNMWWLRASAIGFLCSCGLLFMWKRIRVRNRQENR